MTGARRETTVEFEMVHAGRIYGYRETPPKWRCVTCGREGHGDKNGPAPELWAKACLRGHSRCRWCGRELAVCLDGSPRVHARCRLRPADNEAAWSSAKREARVSRLRDGIGQEVEPS